MNAERDILQMECADGRQQHPAHRPAHHIDGVTEP